MARVYVGMSGGVDSSLSAALLVEQGHEVLGVYMKNWTQDLPGMTCPWAEDLSDAKRVAVQLGIPFKVYDFQAEYKQKVVDYMISEYSAGRTPNPDVMCNQEVKFKLFLDTALADGADLIATGHYARVDNSVSSSGRSIGQHTRLLKARDTDKDQTYFLYRISAAALDKTLFPLGQFTKTEVRAMAAERKLLTATRKESMGICFVGTVGIKEFLSEFVQTEPGDIVDYDSKAIVGKHEGAIFYTLGQRHGLNLGGGLPYYVVGKSMANNEVYVSRNLNSQAMWCRELLLTTTHWINRPPRQTDALHVRLRHRGQLKACTVQGENYQELKLIEPERAVASGQSAVLYRGDEVLGGGFIQ